MITLTFEAESRGELERIISEYAADWMSRPPMEHKHEQRNMNLADVLVVDCELTTRAVNHIQVHGVNTMGELSENVGRNKLRGTRGIGRKTLREIDEMMDHLNLPWRAAEQVKWGGLP
jgi:DNA-directed RNA polymerase alpha subunit